MSLKLRQSASLQAPLIRPSVVYQRRKEDLWVVSQRVGLWQRSRIGGRIKCMTTDLKVGSTRLQVSASRDDIRIAAPNVDLESLPGYLKKECLLFYYPDQAPLARKVAEASSSIQLSEVKWA